MKTSLATAALAIGLATGLCGAAERAKPAKPNIIFILTDDLGYGDVGVFFQNQRAAKKDPAEPAHLTPHLDRMAHEGMQFRQSYAATPVCVSSRSSLLTGLTQGHTLVRDNQFDWEMADNYTLASVMQTAGYRTAAFGKWGLQGEHEHDKERRKKTPLVTDAHQWPSFPLKRGFDYYYGYARHIDGHWHYPFEDHRQVWDNYTNVEPDLKLCYTTDLFTARCKKWIVDHEKDQPGQPFFIYLAYDTPHAKLQNPPCPYPTGGGLHGGVQWIGTPGHMINTAVGKYDSYEYPEYANATWDDDHNPATPEKPWPDVYQRYATDVRRIDDNVGDLFQLLKDLKIDNNTLVIFTSDNGPSVESYLEGKDIHGNPRNYTPVFFHSFGPFDGIKRDSWEGGMRMPTLARWPGHVPADNINQTPIGHWDFLATFTNLAGLPAPERSDGVSLVPTLTGRGPQDPTLIYSEYQVGGKTPGFLAFLPAHRNRKRGQMQVLRFGDYVGVRYDIKSSADDFEIYNVVQDPQEAHNLYAESPSQYAQLQERMKAAAVSQRVANPSAPRPYDNATIPAITLDKTAPGAQWRFYKGEWPWLPQFETMTPDARGSSAELRLADTPLAHDNEAAGLLYDGFINVPETGSYTFDLTSDGPAFLRIHNAQVIDADFGHKPGETKQGRVILQKGLHPFRLYYAHKPAGPNASLDLEWSGPGLARQPIPAAAILHDAEHPDLIHLLDATE